MTFATHHYRNARETLAYIDEIKCEVENLLYSKAHLLASGIHVPTQDFRHAIDCIYEVIDDLYYNERQKAVEIMNAYALHNSY